jgi:hypothetical protein
MYIWERLRGLKVTLSVWARGQADGSQIVRSPTTTSAPKKETLWASEDIYPEGKRIETEILTDNVYDEQIGEVARKLKGERYWYLRELNRADEILCRKETGQYCRQHVEMSLRKWRATTNHRRDSSAQFQHTRIILATISISVAVVGELERFTPEWFVSWGTFIDFDVGGETRLWLSERWIWSAVELNNLNEDTDCEFL